MATTRKTEVVEGRRGKKGKTGKLRMGQNEGQSNGTRQDAENWPSPVESPRR